MKKMAAAVAPPTACFTPMTDGSLVTAAGQEQNQSHAPRRRSAGGPQTKILRLKRQSWSGAPPRWEEKRSTLDQRLEKPLHFPPKHRRSIAARSCDHLKEPEKQEQTEGGAIVKERFIQASAPMRSVFENVNCN